MVENPLDSAGVNLYKEKFPRISLTNRFLPWHTL